MVAALAALAAAPSHAADVGFVDDPGTPNLVLAPSPPGVDDAIVYQVALNASYNNACNAENLSGTPSITVSEPARTIDVAFDETAIGTLVCAPFVLPVNELEAEFGPLAAGAWTLTIEAAPLVGIGAQTVPFTVVAPAVPLAGPAALLALAAALGFAGGLRRLRRSS